MNKDDISIATMTWARNEEEEKLLREAMRYLAEERMTVFVTDGGSGPSFVDFLSSFPNFQILKSDAPGVVAQTKRSLKAAYNLGTKYIFYTESDKDLFFSNKLREFLSDAPNDDQVGVILASRSAESFSTYPESQRYAESVINHLCARIVGEQGDFVYGPLILNRALIPYLELMKEDLGWGWRFFIMVIAKRLGYRIIPWVADLPCPPEQQEDSQMELIHRMRQLSQNIQGLVLSTTIPETQLQTS